ncbi:MAG: ATP-binding protein [Rhodobacteraceae bacterium]|nr:ATP-binding protein [Paracoccaceae bacterium]MCY4250878.1 ATP-binding protein [Paracoccaceae bacterium]MCY4307049.1 ATP-binding protein [Paracoccaceae bacterium]
MNITDPDEGLVKLQQVVEDFSDSHDWPAELNFKIQLILEEIILNALYYGNPGNETNVIFKLIDDGRDISMEIIDDGRPFDPLKEAPVPNTDAELEDRSIGGLGVHLVKSMVSEISYERKNDRNTLRISVDKS